MSDGWRARALLLALPVALAACAGNQVEDQDYVERPVDELYNTALDQLQEGQNRSAAASFDEVERQHPYSQWATRGQLMSAFALYRAEDYAQAVNAAKRFIELHPGHKDVPYAHYLIGMSYYDQISDVGRDQKMTQDALQAFEELIRRYPESDYAQDAKLKVDLTLDNLAGKEMSIGRYYQQQGKYVAAVNRFRTVVEKYQTTSHVEEALHRLTESYVALGVRDEAQRTAAVLGSNYPKSSWYRDSYALVTGKPLPPNVAEAPRPEVTEAKAQAPADGQADGGRSGFLGKSIFEYLFN